MKARIIVLALVAMLAALALMGSGSASAATGTTEAALSNSSLLGTQAQTFTDGSTMTSTVSPDTTAALVVGGDGYVCGDVGYNATVKWYMALTNWVSWTWRMHFGAHVCHNKVQSVNSLYASVVSEMPTWSYCGDISKNWGPTLPYSSAHSFMEGCFQIFDKILVQKFPWARMTIGGNGGLWARSTGVYS